MFASMFAVVLLLFLTSTKGHININKTQLEVSSSIFSFVLHTNALTCVHQQARGNKKWKWMVLS